MKDTVSNVKMSDIVQAWIMLNGKMFSLQDWPMHKAFYDGRYRRTLMMTSRQVAKSTTLANFMVIESTLIPHFSSMFVSPSKEQTTRFSTTRVGKTMRYSPIINETFLHTELADRVLHKQFTNGSEMLFTYAAEDAERLRGPSSDRNMYDEVQDILYSPVITVGNETMANSDYAYETYAGTPKSMENTIQYLWETSSQTEWVMKCPSCGSFQIIRSEKSIGLKGPVCLKCQAYLNPFKGVWMDTNSILLAKNPDPAEMLKGFHLCQPMMPYNVPAAMAHRGKESEDIALKRWKRILTKLEGNPIAIFRNEVLGISDAVGSRLLSIEDLYKLCTTEHLEPNPNHIIRKKYSYIVAGVDWSGGGTTGVSRTVLWIWGWNPTIQKLETLHYVIFPGKNPIHIIDDIAEVCNAWGVALVGGDAGEGHLANQELKQRLGSHRVIQLQYGSQKKPMTWNGIDRYTLDRTTVIDNYFLAIKKEHFTFKLQGEMMPAIEDIMNEYEEVTTTGKKVWRHSPQKPDDCLHAGIFGWLASKIHQNDVAFG